MQTKISIHEVYSESISNGESLYSTDTVDQIQDNNDFYSIATGVG